MNSPNNKEYKATLTIPYPPVCAESCCKDYAWAMLSNIGSDNSEMSAVSMYFYNSVILKPDYADFAACFHSISIVEMHHLDIFATLACQMGLDPRLWSMENHDLCYWTPSYNHYPQMLCELLENSIQGELAAIQKYTRQAETIRDTNIKDNLNRIILDEQHHIELFQSMLREIRNG